MEARHIPAIACPICGATAAKPDSFNAEICEACGALLSNYEHWKADYGMTAYLDFAAYYLSRIAARKSKHGTFIKCRAYRKDGYQCAGYAVAERHRFPVCKAHLHSKNFEAVL